MLETPTKQWLKVDYDRFREFMEIFSRRIVPDYDRQRAAHSFIQISE